MPRKSCMEKFSLRAYVKTPVIKRGQVTLDALLMAVRGCGDVSDLLQCVDGLYFASAGMSDQSGLFQRASFVASMRPEHTPEWRDVIRPNTKTEGLPPDALQTPGARLNDIMIGVARQRTAGNVLSAYTAHVTAFIEWHAVGHLHQVFEVLQDVPFIGKKRTAGYGEVTHWELGDSDLDGIVGYLGEPLRPVPVDRWEHGGDWIPLEAAWKAPYWEVRNRTKCYVPFAL